MTAAELIRALAGRNGMARCPAHDDRTPSLSISDGRDGKLLVHCHAGCSQEAVWAALKDRGLVGNGENGNRFPDSVTRVTGSKASAATPTDRRREAWDIWQAAVPALNTPAQAYSQGRGITVEPPACLRYHRRLNALVALVQAPDGSFSGIQRIYLHNFGNRLHHRGKFSLGPVAGGAVRLKPAAESLQLCESIEDGLALLQMTGRPTWAVPGVWNFVCFKPPPEVPELVLAPDNDDAGRNAITATCKALEDNNLTIRQLLPPPGMDWCNVLEDLDERLAIRQEPEPARSWVEEFVNG